MTSLTEISPGKQFENIIIEICTLEGPVSSGNEGDPEPYHMALVTDGNLYVKMLYKVNESIIASEFQPSNHYIISGNSTIHFYLNDIY